MLAGLVVTPFCSAVTTFNGDIVLPRSSNPYTQENRYLQTLLQRALAASGNDTIKVRYSEETMNAARANYFLQHNQVINLNWLSASKGTELGLNAIPIPLYKGLHGKRVFIIRSDRQADFARVKNLQALAQKLCVQSEGWSDFEVLKRNGLSIDGQLDYPGMIKALRDGLADYFPRSALAVKQEMQQLQGTSLVIESSLLLSYPNNYYFFTHPTQKELAESLLQGLQQLVTSGEFDALFNQYHGDQLEGLNLEQRTLLELNHTHQQPQARPEMRRGV